MNTSERLSMLIEYSGLNAAKFAEKINAKTKQAVYDLLKGKTKSISSDMENKIISCFPQINRVWLLTGEGEMLNSTYSNNRVTMNGNENVSNIGGQHISISLPEEGSQKIIKPDGTVEVHSMGKNIDNSNNTDKFIEIIKKKDEQIDRLITLLEKK